jgi:hypothetical protein
MADDSTLDPAPEVLTFGRFWQFLEAHPNCILRAGTPEAALFDDEDLHWHLAKAEEGVLLVQLVRGKRLLAEIALRGSDIDLVQASQETDEEGDFHLFELFVRGSDGDVPGYYFVLSHGFEEERATGAGRWVH